MTVSLDFEIRSRLNQLLRGESSLQEFQDWLFQSTASMGHKDDALINDLAREIFLLFAEFSSGHWTESELKEQLRPLATYFLLSALPDRPRLSFSSTSIVTRPWAAVVAPPEILLHRQSVKVS